MDPVGISVIFALLLTALGLIYAYLQKKLNYWKDRNVPHPKPNIIYGNTRDYQKKPFHEVELERYRKFGRIYGSFEGLRPIITVGDPSLLRNIFVKDFHIFFSRREFKFYDPILDNMLSVVSGEKWKRIRSIVSPTFSSSKMRKMMHLIQDCASTLLRNIQEATKNDEEIDCKQFYSAFGMDVISSCAFGTKLDSHKDRKNPFVQNADKISSQKLTMRLVLFFAFPFLIRLFRISLVSKEILSFFRSASLHIIGQRKETKEKRNDFLQLLLDAQREAPADEEDMVDKSEQEQQAQTVPRSKTLTEEELLAQCVIFFLAGHDTVFNSLSLVTYNLAKNPDVQERLIKEVDETWEKEDGLTFDALMKMRYLDAVISESLRLHTIAIRAERKCEEDYTLGDTGIVVPKGMIIVIPIYAMHHDPEWYPDPEKFDPERFLTDERTFPPYTYLPFGEGPRNCVAMRFALMEVKTCLFYLLRHIRFVATENTKVECEIGQNLLKSKNMFVKIRKRTDVK